MAHITDWIALVISIMALIVSAYFSYQNTLKRKAKIHYFESWDMHLPTLLPKQPKLVLNVLLHHMYLSYNIEIENRGDKESKHVELKFQNLNSLKITSEKTSIDYIFNVLRWEPLTFTKPVFDASIVRLDKLPPFYNLKLFFTLPISKQKTDILQDDIPYIESINCKNVPITRMNEQPFEVGSLKRLQEKLQLQFHSQIEKLKKEKIDSIQEVTKDV